MATTKLNKDSKDQAYRRFVPDQVLTALQLNDVIDYFECQDRYSRICLSGVGIACGLQVNFKKKTIEVTKGCAVTTDGDLISFKGARYTMVKPFEDVDAKYSRFAGIPLLQLVTVEAAEESGVVLLDTVENLDNMVVVLYLEYYCRDETPCTSTDCDTQGQRQIAKIRVLLITKEDVKKISNKDNDPIFDKHNNTKKFIDLPEIDVKRVILLNSYVTTSKGEQVISQNSNTTNYFRCKDSYRKAIQNTTVLIQLKNAVTKLFTDFKGLLDTDSLGVKAININKKIDTLFDFNVKNIPIDIQYRYDLLKDLVDTYKEIKCLLHDLRVVCYPDISSFPKHLLLAELDPAEKYLQCRHSFYPSQIIPHGKEKLEEIRALILKIHFMLNEYQIPQSTRTPIKVTPSKNCDKILSNRAIPYYYKTTPNLIENWNYDKTKKFSAEENLGYQTTNLSTRDAVQNPLDYTIDDHDFYRIEGHLGKNYRTAIKNLDKIKTDKGLAFDIKVLSIDETLDSINPADFECEFEDLNAVLKAWRAEQNCLNAGISKFFSGFSLKNQGQHKFYKLSKASVSTTISGASDIGDTPITTRSSSSSISSLLSPTISGRSTDILLDTAAIKASFGRVSAFQPIYHIDTVIVDNLEKDEDVLGNIVEKAMKEKPEGSAEDIIAIVRSAVDQDQEIATWDTDVKNVAINQPFEILAFTKVATRFIPNNVAEMSIDRINNYDKTIKNLCNRVESFKKNMTRLLFDSKAKYKRSGHEQQYALLLNQLSVNCCAAEKMKVLLAEIQERKKKILEQKLLSKFVEKHSGLEHKAGVKPGGTFVMVYKGRSKPKRFFDRTDLFAGNILSDAVLNPNIGLLGRTPTTNISAIRTLESNLTSENLTSRVGVRGANLASINPALLTAGLNTNVFTPNILDALSDRFILPPISNVTENTVVADFTLPYSCCSDCAPIVFIVPKTPTSLRLPVDFICLDAKTKPIAFEVSPVDGVVAADIEEGLNGGVIQKDGKFFFDAKKLSKELLGKEIKFTVNGQFTDTKIIAFIKPEFDFVTSNPRFFKENKAAAVNFTVQGNKLPDGVSYFWDFGDGTIPDNRTDENPRHDYLLDLDKDNTQTITVSLTVTNGRCSHTVEHEIIFKPIIASLKIVSEVCLTGSENSDKKIPFEVTPTGATVKLVKQFDKLKINKADLVFQLGFKTFNQPIGFMVDGKQVKTQIIARNKPQARIVLPPQGKLVIGVATDRVNVKFKINNINGFNEDVQSYKWTFGDGATSTSTSKEPKHTYIAPDNTSNGEFLSFSVSLVISSKVCGVKIFRSTVRILVERLI